MKKKLLSIWVCFLIAFIGIVILPNSNVIAEDERYINGIAYDLEEQPLDGYDVDITNLDLEETVTVETDENGEFGICVDDYDWDGDFDVEIKIIAEQYAYMTIAFIESMPEITLIFTLDPSSPSFPDHSGCPTNPYIGYQHNYFKLNGEAEFDFDSTNSERFGRLTTTNSFVSTFDTRYNDPRTLGKEFRERAKVFAQLVGSQGSGYSWEDTWTGAFNPPYDPGSEFVGVQVTNPGGIRNQWNMFYSAAGYDVEERADSQSPWIDSGCSGTSGLNHWIWYPQT